MEAQIEDQTQVPVFYEKFKETISWKIKLFRSTSDFIDNVHVTRLEKESLKRILGLSKQQEKKIVSVFTWLWKHASIVQDLK